MSLYMSNPDFYEKPESMEFLLYTLTLQNDLGNITLISSRPRDSNTEPPCLVEWRKKQEERIKVKDEEEARRKNELREKARQELDAW